MKVCDICGSSKRIGFIHFRYGFADTEGFLDICSKCLEKINLEKTTKKMKNDVKLRDKE